MPPVRQSSTGSRQRGGGNSGDGRRAETPNSSRGGRGAAGTSSARRGRADAAKQRPDSGASRPGSGTSQGSAGGEDSASARLREVQADFAEKMRELAAVKEDSQRRKDSYMRRETKLQQEIAMLKTSLDEAVNGRPMNEQMNLIRGTHNAIQSRIEDMQDRTASLLQQQKESITRQFKTKLEDTLQASQGGQDEPEHSAEEWASRFRDAQAHLMSTETAWKDCDRKNKLLDEENKRLKTQFRAQENDREFLMRQHVSVKRDNARLHEEMNRLNSKNRNKAALRQEGGGAGSPEADGASSRGGSASAGGGGSSAGNRYRDTILRLRKLLDKERGQLRQVRASFATAMQRRTDLEKFLADCISDVRRDITRRWQAEQETAARHSRTRAATQASITDFEAQDRQKVMEILLSQERVIKLLYEKTFVRGDDHAGAPGQQALPRPPSGTAWQQSPVAGGRPASGGGGRPSSSSSRGSGRASEAGRGGTPGVPPLRLGVSNSSSYRPSTAPGLGQEF